MKKIYTIIVGVVVAAAMYSIFEINRLSNIPSGIATTRTYCKNNLKQIGLALYNYHDEHGMYPPAYLTDDEGKPAHSWRVLLLPFLDQGELFEQYSFDEPWDGPNNSKLAEKIPSIYRCLSYVHDHLENGREPPHIQTMTNYAAITVPDGLFYKDRSLSKEDVTDRSKTIVVIETRGHSIHWMQPDDVTEAEILLDLRIANQSDRANHKGCLHVLSIDGRVVELPHDIDRRTFHALITRNGGERVGEF